MLLTHSLVVEAFLQVASRVEGHGRRVNWSGCYAHEGNEQESDGRELHIVVGDGDPGRARKFVSEYPGRSAVSA